MIANLERHEAELNDAIARLEAAIENGAGDVSELRRRIAELENLLESDVSFPRLSRWRYPIRPVMRMRRWRHIAPLWSQSG